jgi:hypothetical protein
MRKAILTLSVAAALAAPLAQATIYEFNASLSGAKENPPNASTASGIATLSYNDFNTADVADDRYNFSLSVFGLTTEASAWHIHGAATPAENAPVRVALDAAPFVWLKSGGTLLVGGNNVPAPATIPATPPSSTNAGHPEMSFLNMLLGNDSGPVGLAYVNVHTPAPLGFPGGEVRGQLIQVTPVPEPETYALMLAGLGFIGWAASRRRARQV